MPALPTLEDNSLHASASPLEALCERINWLQLDPSKDKVTPPHAMPCYVLACSAGNLSHHLPLHPIPFRHLICPSPSQFGQQLLYMGITTATLKYWSKDPHLLLPGGEMPNLTQCTRCPDSHHLHFSCTCLKSTYSLRCRQGARLPRGHHAQRRQGEGVPLRPARGSGLYQGRQEVQR